MASLVAEAALAVMPKNPKDFNVDSVRVVKVLGGGLDASRIVRGMVFGREPEGMHPHILVEEHYLTYDRGGEKGHESESCGIYVRT